MSHHKLRDNAKTPSSIWLKELSALIAPVKAQATTLSEQEINTAIDDTVRAVRKVHHEAA